MEEKKSKRSVRLFRELIIKLLISYNREKYH